MVDLGSLVAEDYVHRVNITRSHFSQLELAQAQWTGPDNSFLPREQRNHNPKQNVYFRPAKMAEVAQKTIHISKNSTTLRRLRRDSHLPLSHGSNPVFPSTRLIALPLQHRCPQKHSFHTHSSPCLSNIKSPTSRAGRSRLKKSSLDSCAFGALASWWIGLSCR